MTPKVGRYCDYRSQSIIYFILLIYCPSCNLCSLVFPREAVQEKNLNTVKQICFPLARAVGDSHLENKGQMAVVPSKWIKKILMPKAPECSGNI